MTISVHTTQPVQLWLQLSPHNHLSLLLEAMLHGLKFHIVGRLIDVNGVLLLLVQLVADRLFDADRGNYPLRLMFPHNQHMLLDDAQSLMCIFLLGTSHGFYLHDRAVPLVSYRFYFFAVSFQILVGQGKVVMMNFLMWYLIFLITVAESVTILLVAFPIFLFALPCSPPVF